MIRSRAPVRIDFAGGWTDVALFAESEAGSVVNASIQIYSFAMLTRKQTVLGINSKNIDKGIRIYSADFDTFIEAEDIRELEYDGSIDLVKAAVRRMSVPSGGFDLISQSIAPPGSGLGTSAAMGVALISALARHQQNTYLPFEIAELASQIERQELQILGGKQDHYASAIGGINYMEFRGEMVKTAQLKLTQDVQHELEKNLLLCYTGKSRLSGNIHQNVTESYQAEAPETLDALSNLRSVAKQVKSALMNGDLTTFGELLSENWKNQKRLHSSVTNDEIESLFEVAMANGAIGGKACGAGGGGCLLFYCQPDKEHQVRRSLVESGVTILDFTFDFLGLQTWVSNH